MGAMYRGSVSVSFLGYYTGYPDNRTKLKIPFLQSQEKKEKRVTRKERKIIKDRGEEGKG